MILEAAAIGQGIKTSGGTVATVLAHGRSGTLVKAFHHLETPFEGRLFRGRTVKHEVWSNATVCEPLGQLVLEL